MSDTTTTEPTHTADPTPADPGESTQERCNVPGCHRAPKTRGLCDAHWATHRGYATPRE